MATKTVQDTAPESLAEARTALAHKAAMEIEALADFAIPNVADDADGIPTLCILRRIKKLTQIQGAAFEADQHEVNEILTRFDD